MADERVVPVTIHGQRYPVRSDLDPAYVARLAAYVDERMRIASDTAPSGDAMRIAVFINNTFHSVAQDSMNPARDNSKQRAYLRGGSFFHRAGDCDTLGH